MHKNMGVLPANIQQAAKNREIERAALNFINAAILVCPVGIRSNG